MRTVCVGAAGFAVLAAAAPRCPGSDALVHASCSLEASASVSCSEVVSEIQARVGGQYSSWHDPHNNGTYAIQSHADGELLLTRTSGSKSVGGKKFTDKVLLTFADAGNGGCTIDACSESQVFSIVDFSTNYCNIRNLYCGSADGCSPLTNDFTTTEKSVSTSAGAGKDPSACVVAAAKAPSQGVLAVEAAAVAPAALVTSASVGEGGGEGLAAGQVVAGPCCNRSCTPPLVKFFSVDAPHGFCGETCLNPLEYPVFHAFEANLTRAENEHPCQDLWTPSNTKRYTDYLSTVTHGDPLGIFKATLDLYAPTGMPNHTCCVSAPAREPSCSGHPERPALVSVFGTGPFCCPSGASEEEPCPSRAAPDLVV